MLFSFPPIFFVREPVFDDFLSIFHRFLMILSHLLSENHFSPLEPPPRAHPKRTLDILHYYWGKTKNVVFFKGAPKSHFSDDFGDFHKIVFPTILRRISVVFCLFERRVAKTLPRPGPGLAKILPTTSPSTNAYSTSPDSVKKL